MKVWQICVFIHINFGWLCSCVNHIQSNACRRFIMKSSLLRFTKSIYCPDLVQTRLGKIKTLGATVSVFALKQCQELWILLTFLHCKGNSCGARLPFFCPACCRRRGQSQGMKFGDGINWMDRAFWKWSIQRAQDKLQNGPPSSFFLFSKVDAPRQSCWSLFFAGQVHLPRSCSTDIAQFAAGPRPTKHFPLVRCNVETGWNWQARNI